MRPLWTPDGTRLTFASNRDGPWGIYWQAADGSSPAERLVAADQGVEYWPDSWAADTKTLVFTRIDGSLDSIQQQTIWTVQVDEDGAAGEPEAFVEVQAGGASFSPNGQWIAYRSTDPEAGPTNQIHVQPFPRTGAVYAVTDGEGGSYPIWTSDGDEMLYRRPTTGGNIPLAFGIIDVRTDRSFAWGNESEIQIPGGVAFFGYRDYDFLPGGDGLIVSINPVSAQTASDNSPEIQIVTNWIDLVRERAPVQ